jgi:hypothetical protein
LAHCAVQLLGLWLRHGVSLLSERDKKRLHGVHPHMASLIAEASVIVPKRYKELSIFVIYGVRSREEQYRIWRECHEPDGTPNGNPWKTNLNGTPKGKRTPEGSPGTGVSRHQSGNAVDVGVNVNGKLTWNEDEYDKVANVILELAAKNKVPVVWGGNFKSRKDRPHYELNQKFYP